MVSKPYTSEYSNTRCESNTVTCLPAGFDPIINKHRACTSNMCIHYARTLQQTSTLIRRAGRSTASALCMQICCSTIYADRLLATASG
jgi:hypothetical protein